MKTALYFLLFSIASSSLCSDALYRQELVDSIIHASKTYIEKKTNKNSCNKLIFSQDFLNEINECIENEKNNANVIYDDYQFLINIDIIISLFFEPSKNTLYYYNDLYGHIVLLSTIIKNDLEQFQLPFPTLPK